MSSSETVTRRHPLAFAAALGLAALVGGCFQPLYGEGTVSKVGGNVRNAMLGIDVPEIKGLVGHYLRNELVFEFDGGGEADRQKTLKLTATTRESLEVITVDYANGRADSAVLVATADWQLTRVGSNEVVASGQSVVRAPYERAQQRFASLRAARDAQLRAAKNLAQLIKARVAASLVAG
jgi:LPS-assembly lipoprotein